MELRKVRSKENGLKMKKKTFFFDFSILPNKHPKSIMNVSGMMFGPILKGSTFFQRFFDDLTRIFNKNLKIWDFTENWKK